MDVSQTIGKAIQKGFDPVKVGLLIAGLEVAHVHIHRVPIWGLHDLDYDNQASNVSLAELERAAEIIREALSNLGLRKSTDETWADG